MSKKITILICFLLLIGALNVSAVTNNSGNNRPRSFSAWKTIYLAKKNANPNRLKKFSVNFSKLRQQLNTSEKSNRLMFQRLKLNNRAQ